MEMCCFLILRNFLETFCIKSISLTYNFKFHYTEPCVFHGAPSVKECSCHLYVIIWLVLHSNLNKTGSTSPPIYWEQHSTDRKVRTHGNLPYGSFCFPHTIKFFWEKQKLISLTEGSSAFCVASSRDGRFWSLYTTTEWEPLCLLSCKEGHLLAFFLFLQQLHTYSGVKWKSCPSYRWGTN